MTNFFWAIGASAVNSLISLIGVFALLVKDKWLDKILGSLIGFAAGGLIGGAFLHLLPEAIEQSNNPDVFVYVIAGFIFFFILEKYLHWRHCHNGVCAVHTFTYLNLIGDTIHNFVDGLVIGTSFIVSVRFGVVTTLAIIFHEIPQEIGDFGVLVYGGFTKIKAIFYNFLSGLVCILGTIVGFYLSGHIGGAFSVFVLPFTAGGFIYIAACDLIPEIHKQQNLKKAIFSMFAFLLGVVFIMISRRL